MLDLLCVHTQINFHLRYLQAKGNSSEYPQKNHLHCRAAEMRTQRVKLFFYNNFRSLGQV